MSSAEEVVILARLTGTREVLANASAMGLAMEELGVETNAAGLAMEHTAKRSWLMNQALFTMRRLVYATSLAFIASGVLAVKWGWDFNNAMQSARYALQPVAADLGNVQAELDYLFNFTKHTPFQFKDVTIAFRQMYLGMRTIGISADTVNQTIVAMTDALSATGRTSPGALNRVAVALQHMAYLGHVTGQVVMQLARDGLPIYAALTKELGLTGDQIHNIGKLGIPAQDVLKALNTYIESTPGFMHAAYIQSLTVHGLFTTIKDDIMQLSGSLEQNLFKRTQRNFVNITLWFDRFNERVKGAKSATDVVAAINPAFLPIWTQLAGVIHQTWLAFKSLIDGVAHSQAIWATVYTGLLTLKVVLLLLNPLLKASQYWLNILVPLWVGFWIATKAAAFWTAALRLEEVLATTAVKDLTFFQFLAKVVIGDFAIMERLATAATWLYVAAQAALSAVTEEVIVSMLALAIAMELNPVFIIITALVLLIATLGILYLKWGWFHRAVDKTWHFIWDNKHWIAMGIAAAFAPLLIAYEVLKHIADIWNGLKGAWHWLGRVLNPGGGTGANPALGGTLNLPGQTAPLTPNYPSMGIPLNQNGVKVQRHRGTGNGNVAPLFNMPEAWMGGKRQPVQIQLHVGKRQLANVLTEIQTDGLARA